MTTQTKPYDRFFEKAAQAVLFGDPVSHEVAQHLLDLIDERDEQIAILEDKDEGVSGDDPGREGFERALEAACRHKAVLVVYDITCFAREARLGLEMWDRLIKAKAHLAAVAEGINTLSPLGKHITKLIFTILSGVAEMQLAMIRERTSKAMRHYQAQGRRMGRLDRCPYGKMPDPDGPMVKDKETGQLTDRPAQMIDEPEEP